MLDLIHELTQILADIAVIVSLVFVGVQVRDNTKAVRTSIAQASVVNWADASLAVATSDDLIGALIVDRYPMHTPVTKDQERTFWFSGVALKTVEFNYLQWLEGNLSDDLWAGSRAGIVSHFASQQFYERDWPSASGFYSPRFQALVNKEIIPEARAARAKFYHDNRDQVDPSELAPATDTSI